MSSPTLLPGSLLGAERPRVEVRPPGIEYTLGPEAAELASRAGLPLEPWQRAGLDLMLSVRSDGRWACFEYGEICARQNGKSAMFMARALAGLFLLGERLVMWSAHEYKTSMEAFLAMRALIEALGEPVEGKRGNVIRIGRTLVKINNTNGEEAFERLDTRQRLKFVARSKGSGRGFTADCHLIDEAFAYTQLQHSALMPTLNAVANPQIAYASSPPLDGQSGEVLFGLRARAESVTPGDLGWRDWGLAGDLDSLMQMSPGDRRAFLDDRERWAATNPALGRGRVGPESIARNRASLDEASFGREILGLWPRRSTGADWAVIPKGTWMARGGAFDRPDGPVVFAVAAAYPDAEFGSIAVAGRRDGELLTQVVEHREGTSWLVARAQELRDRHGPIAVLLDKKGPARHLIPEFEAAGIALTHPSMDEIAQAAAVFYAETAGDAPTLRHYDQPELDDALAAAQKRPIGDGWTWMRKGATDISPLEAATLAAWGAVHFQPADVPPPVAVSSSSGSRPETADLSRAGF